MKPKIGIPIINKKYSDYLRLKIYSYFKFKELILKISKVSKKEKELLASTSEILNQERVLKLRFPKRISID
jgi:hypothetical protein